MSFVENMLLDLLRQADPAGRLAGDIAGMLGRIRSHPAPVVPSPRPVPPSPPPPDPGPPPPGRLDQIAIWAGVVVPEGHEQMQLCWDLLLMHNALRQVNGLPPLAPEGRLARAALWQAVNCADVDRLSHDGLDGSTSGQRIAAVGYPIANCGENASWQPSPPPNPVSGAPIPEFAQTPARAFDAWTKSPGHLANILGPYTQMGAGVAYSRTRAAYHVVCFGTPRES